MGDLEQETLHLAQQAGEAKLSLTAKGSQGSRRWFWFWRGCAIAGIAMFFVITLLVVGALETTLNEHTGQITNLKTELSSNHGLSYPVVVHLCESIPKCSVTLTPAEIKAAQPKTRG